LQLGITGCCEGAMGIARGDPAWKTMSCLPVFSVPSGQTGILPDEGLHTFFLVRRSRLLILAYLFGSGRLEMAKADELLAEYGAYHRTRGNIACHFVGIPLIILGLLASLASLPIVELGGMTVTGAEVLILIGTIVYLTLDIRFAIGMLAITAALDLAGRAIGWKVGLATFVIGWVIQGIGHAVFEKRSPAFLKNLIHLLVGPAFLLNEVFFSPRRRAKESQ